MPERAFIALGSNIDPESNLIRAALGLQELGTLVAASGVYQNPAIGREEQPDYLNAAILLETVLPPLELRSELRRLERELGRVRTADRYATRTIDLDLCLYSNMELDTSELTLPDPDILRRAHLAVTLSELDPGYILPQKNEPLEAIAQRLRSEADLKLREDVSSKLRQLIEE